MSSEHWSPKNQPGPPPYGGRGVQPAEWWERFVARLIDGVLFGITTMIVSAILFAVLVPLLAFAAYGGSRARCSSWRT